jgi:hypothetical protein
MDQPIPWHVSLLQLLPCAGLLQGRHSLSHLHCCKPRACMQFNLTVLKKDVIQAHRSKKKTRDGITFMTK